MLRIFSTKELEQHYHEGALKRNIQLFENPFIVIHPLYSDQEKAKMAPLLRSGNQILIFTSKNAVEAALEYYLKDFSKDVRSGWRFYCIAGATRTALLNQFKESQLLGSADHAADLVKQFSFKGNESVHFFCGNLRRNTIPEFLKIHFVPFFEWIVYRTEANPQKVEEEYDGYLFYSPSEVSSFFSVNKIGTERPCFSIGRTTAAAVRSFVPNPVFISERTDTPHLLDLVENYFKN